MEKTLKVLSLVLLLSVGLVAGCSDDQGTAVDPKDMDAMTNGFTEGNGDIDEMIVEGLLKASPYMAMGEGYMPSPKMNFKSSADAFQEAFRPLNQLPVPYLHEFMNIVMTYAITGKPFDRTGTVAKMLGNSLEFQSINPRITLSELIVGAPRCIYIDGLPESIEAIIIAIAAEIEPSEAQITAAMEDLPDLIENFDITIGAIDVCELSSTPGAATLEGSVNIKGGVEIATDNFKADVTVTVNGIEFNTMTDDDNNQKITATGSLGFNTETEIDEEGFDFDFRFWVNSVDVNITGKDTAVDFEQRVFVDGALAFNIVAGSVAFEDFMAWISAATEIPIETPAYLPDICNMTLNLIIDFDLIIDMDPAVDNEVEEIPIFFGAKITLENTNGEPVVMCNAPTGTIVYVYFYSADQYYVVTVDSPPSADCTAGTWDYSLDVTGSEGQHILLCVDVETSCDVVIPDGSSVTDFDCTWPEDDLLPL